MKTHLVIDEFFGDAVFAGTYEQCQTWKIKNGHHYYIRPMTEVESGIYNKLKWFTGTTVLNLVQWFIKHLVQWFIKRGELSIKRYLNKIGKVITKYKQDITKEVITNGGLY